MSIGGRKTDSKTPGRLGLSAHDFLLRLHQLSQCLSTLLVESATRLSHADAARGSHEQSRPQTFLKTKNRPADCGGRDTCHLCCRGKTAGFRSETEKLDASKLQVIKMAFHINHTAYLAECPRAYRSRTRTGEQLISGNRSAAIVPRDRGGPRAITPETAECPTARR